MFEVLVKILIFVKITDYTKLKHSYKYDHMSETISRIYFKFSENIIYKQKNCFSNSNSPMDITP